LYSNFDTFVKYISPDPSEAFTHLSINNDSDLLVVAQGEEFNEDIQSLLVKILSSIEIDLKNQASLLLLSKSDKVNISSLISQKGINKIISFGLPPKSLCLNIQIELYKIAKIGDLEVLFVHNLSDLSDNLQFKKELWNQLKSWKKT